MAQFPETLRRQIGRSYDVKKVRNRHLSAVFDAMQDGLFVRPEGMRRDVAWFFSLPIPQAVWEMFAPLQNEDFVQFVEKCRGWK